MISVHDTGPGLSTEQQRLMFQEGVQFNPNQLQAGQGSGLGMWISKEIVTLHQGNISVTSAGLGCGSTFEVTLPVFQSTKSNRSNRVTQRSKHQNCIQMSHCPSLQEQSQLRALIVDDAASNRKLVCRLLQSRGIECEQAENGQECVNLIFSGKFNFDFILLDYEMPILNGPSAAKKLREMKCEILIIGLTGNILPEDKQYFLDHGVNVVFTKPLNIDSLLEYIYSHRSFDV